LLEHRAGDALHLEGAIAAESGDQAAVDVDRVERRRRAANAEIENEALLRRAACHARHAHEDLANRHVGQIAERIHRDDVGHAGSIALRRDRRRRALALSAHLERVQGVDAGGEIEITHGTLPGSDCHLRAGGIEPDVRNSHFMRAGRDTRQDVAPGFVRQGAQAQLRHFDARPLEEIARGAIADGAHEDAGADRRGRGGCKRRNDEQPHGKNNGAG
jgi:hypothetical protein